MHYRIYLLDLANNIIEGADLEAGDDAAACRIASIGLDAGTILELWCGTRYVRQISRR